MAYCLDTNICIALINKQNEKVISQLRKHNPEQIKISIISVAELKYGADKSQAKEKNHNALDKFLATFEVIDFDLRSAAAYGEIRSALAKAGTPIGPLDTLIAAQAVANKLTLVTNNVKEFSRVPELSLEDWLTT